jgi:hypothetical protein
MGGDRKDVDVGLKDGEPFESVASRLCDFSIRPDIKGLGLSLPC